MLSAAAISLSGLNSASQRVSVSANDPANVRSTVMTPAKNARDQRDATGGRRHQPLTVQQRGDPDGGTDADAWPVEPPPVASFEAGRPKADIQEIVQRPGVFLEHDFVALIEARRAYESSMKVTEAAKRAVVGLVLDGLV